NGPLKAHWQFDFYYQGKIVHTIKDYSAQEFTTVYRETFRLLPYGELRPANRPASPAPQTDRWRVRLDADDIGVVLVDGIPVAGVYHSPAGDFDWQDIGNAVSSARLGEIGIQLWNHHGSYALWVQLCRNDELVWEKNVKGIWSLKSLVFSEVVVPEVLSSLGDCPAPTAAPN
ncbi:MAG: hypothetical protein D6784_03670, partial [Chloroflexi bacterium]